MIHPILHYRLIHVMVFTVTISIRINHISLTCGLSLGVAGKLYIVLMLDIIV